MNDKLLSNIILNNCKSVIHYCLNSDFYSILSKSCDNNGFKVSSCDLCVDVTDIISLICNYDKKIISIVLSTLFIHMNSNIVTTIRNNKKCIGLCRHYEDYDRVLLQSQYCSAFMCFKCGNISPCIVVKPKKNNYNINLK